MKVLKWRRFSAAEFNRTLEGFHKTLGVVLIIEDKLNPCLWFIEELIPSHARWWSEDPINFFHAVRRVRVDRIFKRHIFHPSYAFGVKVFQRKSVGIGASVFQVQSN